MPGPGMNPQLRLALMEALGIPMTDLNLQGQGGYSTTQERYPAEVPDQGQPPQMQQPPIDMQEIWRMLQEPPSQPQQPGRPPIGALIMSGLADAIGTKTAIEHGGARPSYMNQLLARRQEEADRRTSMDEQTRKERRQNAMIALEMTAKQQERAADRAARIAEIESGREFSREENAADRAARIAEADRARGFTSEENAKDRAFRRELFMEEQDAAAKRAAREGDPQAIKFDEDTIARLDEIVATELPQLAAIEDPQQRAAAAKRIRSRAVRLAQRGLTPMGAQRAQDIVVDEILPALEGMEAPPQQPQQSMFGAGTVWPPGGATLAAPFLSWLQQPGAGLNRAPLTAEEEAAAKRNPQFGAGRK